MGEINEWEGTRVRTLNGAFSSFEHFKSHFMFLSSTVHEKFNYNNRQLVKCLVKRSSLIIIEVQS